MRSVTLGAGLPALLIPGSDLAHEFYVPLAEQLAEHQICTRILTLPGFFGTPRAEAQGLAPLLDALESELDRHWNENGILIGHSFGGLLAVCLAAAAAGRVRTLVLLEPAIIPSAWLARRAAQAYQRQVAQQGRDEFSNWSGSFLRVHDLERFPRWAIEHYLAVRRATDPALMADWLADLSSLYPLPLARAAMPTLILRGASSGLWMRFGAARLCRALPNATLQTIPGAAHWLANEQDQVIAAHIAQFAKATRKS